MNHLIFSPAAGSIRSVQPTETALRGARLTSQERWYAFIAQRTRAWSVLVDHTPIDYHSRNDPRSVSMMITLVRNCPDGPPLPYFIVIVFFFFFGDLTRSQSSLLPGSLASGPQDLNVQPWAWEVVQLPFTRRQTRHSGWLVEVQAKLLKAVIV